MSIIPSYDECHLLTRFVPFSWELPSNEHFHLNERWLWYYTISNGLKDGLQLIKFQLIKARSLAQRQDNLWCDYSSEHCVETGWMKLHWSQTCTSPCLLLLLYPPSLTVLWIFQLRALTWTQTPIFGSAPKEPDLGGLYFLFIFYNLSVHEIYRTKFCQKNKSNWGIGKNSVSCRQLD